MKYDSPVKQLGRKFKVNYLENEEKKVIMIRAWELSTTENIFKALHPKAQILGIK